MEKYYTVRQAMEMLHRSRSTIFAYINGGLLPATKLRPDAKNSKFLIKESDIEKLLEDGLLENGAPDGYYQRLYPRKHKDGSI